MDQATVRRRLLALRQARGVTQEQLATALEFKDRQTLSDIEGGGRVIAFPELSKAARFFGVKIDYFTDPLKMAGEAKFSWRRSMESGDGLDTFEDRAGDWIAAYRYLRKLKGETVNSSLTQIGLGPKSSFEDAWAEGEAIAQALELGEVPALRLAQALEDQWDTLVLFVDAPTGISGAACQLGAMNTVIINRREPEGRRNYDLAHEVFHLITWSKMEPPHIEQVQTPTKYKRMENLAENFAAGLLMPSHSVEKYLSEMPLPSDEVELKEWIRAAAARFRVSGEAMKWRLVCLKKISKAAALRLEPAVIRVPLGNGLPARFSRPFMEAMGWGISTGHISVRRAAEIVGGGIDDLADLFSEHGLKTPFDL